jgi:type II secretion system protein G
MTHRRFRCLLSLAALLFPALCYGRPQHVVIIVMDGLRRDTITPEQMPVLHALSKDGVFFDRHHPAYPSSTQVNATALATGVKPAHSNIMANREYRPELELLKPIDTNDAYYAWASDKDPSSGGWVHVQTLPEMARAQGLTTVVAGTKAVAVLWDRSYKNRTADQPTLYEGHAIPAAVLDKWQADLGPFPPALDWKYHVNTARDIWTIRALTEYLWADRVPDLSVVWIYEPDFSQHGTGVGSKNAKLAYKSTDDRLKTILDTLDKKGIRDKTDIVIASDHGVSTISRKIDVPDALRRAGFKAEGEYRKPPEKGNIIVTGLGGSVSFYVYGQDEAVRKRLVEYLQKTDWAGVLFTRDGLPGTFRYDDTGIDSPDAPDVVMAMRWKDEVSKHGTRGTVICDGMEPGQGMHVSLAKHDMANTLIAVGPSFKKGVVSTLPSGNLDVAPTVAHLLGLKPAKPFDGRVLGEALVTPPAAEGDEKPQTSTLTTERKVDEKKTWRQYLRFTMYQGRTYYDEGNAGLPPEAQLQADVTNVKAMIKSLEAALDIFEIDNGRFPTSAEGLSALTKQPKDAKNWKGPYIKNDVPKDPWGNALIYKHPGTKNKNGFDLSSAGPDGKPETADDLGNW